MEMTELARKCLRNAERRSKQDAEHRDPARYDAMADKLSVTNQIRVRKRGQRDAWKIRRALMFRGIDVTVRTWRRKYMIVKVAARLA